MLNLLLAEPGGPAGEEAVALPLRLTYQHRSSGGGGGGSGVGSGGGKFGGSGDGGSGRGSPEGGGEAEVVVEFVVHVVAGQLGSICPAKEEVGVEEGPAGCPVDDVPLPPAPLICGDGCSELQQSTASSLGHTLASALFSFAPKRG